MQNRTVRLAIISATVSLSLVAGAAYAQVDPAGGQNRAKVGEALTTVASGSCPERLMSAVLLDQCEMQLPRMTDAMRRLGPIKDIRFRGTDTMPNGTEVEVFRVTFENGQMTWLAATGPNGKLSVLWSPG